MSAKPLPLHKDGLADGPVSEIETAPLNSGGYHHDTKTDCTDLRTQSEACLLIIDKVAQLAKFYAAGNPPDEELRAIKKRVTAASNELPDKDTGAQWAPKECRTGQETRPGGSTHDPHTEIAPEESHFSAGLRALETSIRVSARPSDLRCDGSATAKSLIRGGICRTVALVVFAALIGMTFVWSSHREESKEMVRRLALSADRLLSVSMRNSFPADATSSELLRREAASEVTAARPKAERFGADQEQIYAGGVTTQDIQQNSRSKTSSPPLRSRVKRTAVPETRLTTIDGWMLREVTRDTAVLEGPNGIWRVKRGDTVPGVGRVESIVLWGKRWIVAIGSGLISTP
jgi:hypothetical protein